MRCKTLLQIFDKQRQSVVGLGHYKRRADPQAKTEMEQSKQAHAPQSWCVLPLKFVTDPCFVFVHLLENVWFICWCVGVEALVLFSL